MTNPSAADKVLQDPETGSFQRHPNCILASGHPLSQELPGIMRLQLEVSLEPAMLGTAKDDVYVYLMSDEHFRLNEVLCVCAELPAAPAQLHHLLENPGAGLLAHTANCPVCIVSIPV